jgi:hypothetical protein
MNLESDLIQGQLVALFVDSRYAAVSLPTQYNKT